MTTHYIDITLLPDPEFSHAHLLGALAKLHRALVQLQSASIGVSFPQYRLRPRTMGSVLRLHGDPDALQGLMALAWLQGMRDHVRLTDLAPAPSGAPRYVVQRRQFKTSANACAAAACVAREKRRTRQPQPFPIASSVRSNCPSSV